MTDSSATVLRALSAALALTRGWDETPGRLYLWELFLSLFACFPQFRSHLKAVQFLSTSLTLFRCEEGLALFTICPRREQINVNVVVTRRHDNEAAVVASVGAFLVMTFPEAVINMAPLLHDDDTVPSARRFLSHVTQVPNMALVDDYVFLGSSSVKVHMVLASSRQLVDYTPITKMSTDDPLDMLYWYKFPCGTLVTFRNPVYPLVQTIEPLHPIVDHDVIADNVDARVLPLVRALKPQCVAHVADVMPEVWIPRSVRRFCIVLAKRRVGISDDLILLAGSHFVMELETDSRVHDMLIVCDIMRTAASSSDRLVVSSLITVLRSFGERAMWNAWLRSSPFVVSVVERISPDELRLFIQRFPDARFALELFLQRDDDWTPLCTQKAGVFLETADATFACFDDIQDALRKREACASARASLLILSETRPLASPRTPRASTRVPPVVTAAHHEDCNHHVTDVVADDGATHHGLAKRVAAWLAHEVILIGSGVFTNSSDVDLVITVEKNISLEEAYALVVNASGWAPQYAQVDGVHVSVLRGSFEGVIVDAQVWRGAYAMSEAEIKTAYAIDLSTKIQTELGESSRRMLCYFHEWFHAGDMKKGVLGQLPGVGLTCICMLLTRHNHASTEGAIQQFRDVLQRLNPRVDFDGLNVKEHAPEGRCIETLKVWCNSENCTHRMSVVTTRHLLDFLSFSSKCSREARLVHETFVAWRTSFMVTACVVRPRSSCKTMHSLYNVCKSLDRHPFVETAHVTSLWNDERICLLVTIKASDDALLERYGFRSTDRVDDNAADAFVCVTRSSGRTLTLMKSSRAATVLSTATRTRLADMLPAKGVASSFPNTPSLTADVVHLFDSALWEHVF